MRSTPVGGPYDFLPDGRLAWVSPHRVWRPFGDVAALFAAPWLALIWVLSFGRSGVPLYRWVEDPRAAELRKAQRYWCDHGYIGRACPYHELRQNLWDNPL